MRRSFAGRRDGARGTRVGRAQLVALRFAALFRTGDVWFDADRMDGSNNFIDYNDPAHLATLTGTVSAAAADAALNGAKSVAITGTQWWDSNRAASAFNRTVDGTGNTRVAVLVPTSLAAARILTAVGVGDAVKPGFDAFVSAAGAVNYDVYGAVVAALGVSLGAGSAVVGTGMVVTTTLSTSSGTIRKGALAPVTGVPVSLGAAAATTLRIGAYSDGTFPGSQRVRAVYDFGRVLTPSEYSAVLAKILLQTGLT